MFAQLDSAVVIVVAVALFVFFIFVMFILLLTKQYKRCPPHRLMVIYGKTGSAGRTQLTIHGGAAFVWPLIQDYAYLSLDPITLDLPTTLDAEAIAKGVKLPSTWTFAISTDPDVMQNAAVHLLGLPQQEINRLATDLILGRLEKKLAQFEQPEDRVDSVALLEEWALAVQADLDQLGLKTIGYR